MTDSLKGPCGGGVADLWISARGQSRVLGSGVHVPRRPGQAANEQSKCRILSAPRPVCRSAFGSRYRGFHVCGLNQPI